jgi:predicted nucleotide-binding protein
MQPVLPSQIIEYLDSRYPQAKEQLEGRGGQWYLPIDHVATVTQLLSIVENIPSSLMNLESDDQVEFGEAIAAIRFAINAWNSGDKHYKLEKIPGRHRLNPITLLRKYLIKLSDEVLQPEEANQTPISEQEIHKLYGAIRSEFINLPTQSIRNLAAAAGIDVTRITSKAEKKSGMGSRAEIMPQVDSLFGEMDIEDKMTALKIITQRVIEDRAEVKEKVENILEKHGFQFKDDQFNRIKKSKYSKPITTDKNQSKNAEKEEMVSTAEDPAKVFVVHGRNDNANKAIFSFLRSIGLRPLEWSQILASMNVGSPYIGDILDHAFLQAQAVVVLLTPDDEARLRESLRKPDEQEHEINLTQQARPNVLFEAGMAFGRFPERTIIVELGKLRPFSDIAGRYTVKLDDSTQKRQDLAQRLQKAGCTVDITGTDWHTEGKFNEALSYALKADEPWEEAKDKRPYDYEFKILSKSSSLRPHAFLGDGRIDSRTHLTIRFDFINNRDEIIILNRPEIINLKTNSDLLSNKPAAIRFNHFPTSMQSWVFPHKIEKHSRDLMKCEIDLLITNNDPNYFAEKLNSLKSYEIEFQFSYEDMSASTSVEKIIVDGTYDDFKKDVLNFWKERKRTDLIKLLK